MRQPGSTDLDVIAVHPDPSPRTLSDLIADPQRWGERWPIPESDGYGEPSGHYTLNLTDPGGDTSPGPEGAFFTWLLGTEAIDDDHQLVALYPHGIRPKSSALVLDLAWYYFMGPGFFASEDVPGDLKVDIQQPRVWSIFRDPTSVTSPDLSQFNWNVPL